MTPMAGCLQWNHTHHNNRIKTLKRQNFTFLKIADYVFDELKVQTCVKWFFLMIFLFLLATLLWKLQSCQNMHRPNLPRVPTYPVSPTMIQIVCWLWTCSLIDLATFKRKYSLTVSLLVRVEGCIEYQVCLFAHKLIAVKQRLPGIL